jgi:hypothetical protein
MIRPYEVPQVDLHAKLGGIWTNSEIHRMHSIFGKVKLIYRLTIERARNSKQRATTKIDIKYYFTRH